MSNAKLLRFDRRSRAVEASPPILLTEANLQKFAEQLVAFERASNIHRSGSDTPAQPAVVSVPSSLEDLKSESGAKCPLAIKSDQGA